MAIEIEGSTVSRSYYISLLDNFLCALQYVINVVQLGHHGRRLGRVYAQCLSYCTDVEQRVSGHRHPGAESDQVVHTRGPS